MAERHRTGPRVAHEQDPPPRHRRITEVPGGEVLPGRLHAPLSEKQPGALADPGDEGADVLAAGDPAPLIVWLTGALLGEGGLGLLGRRAVPHRVADLFEPWIDFLVAAEAGQQRRGRLAGTEQRRDEDVVEVLLAETMRQAPRLLCSSFRQRRIVDVQPVSDPLGFSVSNQHDLHDGSLPGVSDNLVLPCVAIEELILVVCTGNTCRSPMAAALLAHHLQERGSTVTVASAGTLGWSGRPATPSAVAALADRGIDLANHRSRSLRDAAEDLTATSLVLAMTRVHGGAVAAHVPHLAARTFLPGELVRLGEQRSSDEPLANWAESAGARRSGHRVIGRAVEEIEDPVGQSFEVYASTAERLDSLMSTIADRLEPRRGGRSTQ